MGPNTRKKHVMRTKVLGQQMGLDHRTELSAMHSLLELNLLHLLLVIDRHITTPHAEIAVNALESSFRCVLIHMSKSGHLLRAQFQGRPDRGRDNHQQ